MSSVQSRRISRRAFLRSAGLGLIALATPGPALLLYGRDVEPNRLALSRVRVEIDRLPPAFEGLTIAQLSDLHFGRLVTAAQIRAAVDAALDLGPDLIVLTGDHATRLEQSNVTPLAQELSRLRAPLGVFAILGNHDYRDASGVTLEALRSAGLTLLRNDNVPIERSGQTIYLAGLDDALKGHPDLAGALHGVPGDSRAIVLVHEPDYADRVSRDPRAALQLSGHSHGGQIRLPLRGPLRLPRLARKYPDGLRRVGSMWLYTNRGIGVVSVPIRINCPPEVTLFELAVAQK